MAAAQTFVIVGASLAGAKAAETLRTEGFEGRVVLIGEETERPYERPYLSKEYLRGDKPAAKLYVHDEGFYADNDIELLTGTRVESLDPVPVRSPCPAAAPWRTAGSCWPRALRRGDSPCPGRTFRECGTCARWPTPTPCAPPSPRRAASW